MAGSVRVRINDAELRRIVTSPDGPVAQDLAKRGRTGANAAQRRCSTAEDRHHGQAPGKLRSKIGSQVGGDQLGLYVDVYAAIWYALFVELGVKPHIIESGGDYPLRTASGAVLGKRLRHPGTQQQPFLRPAVDDMLRAGD
jgi:hypothetical protein